VWIDPHNFLCLERSTDPKGRLSSTAQWFIATRSQRSWISGPIERPYLKIERRGQTLNALISANAIEWEQLKNIDSPPVPDRVHVGVFATSTRPTEFVATFQEYKLTPLPNKRGP
jgi:regulation of enolase protein 1 (concanavalin A-like superfamily)